MQTAYDILGVSEDADDTTIRQAYLQQIRANPPERAPETFARLRDAYEAIKTPQARADYALTPLPMVDPAAVLAAYLRPSAPRRGTPQQWLSALAEEADER